MPASPAPAQPAPPGIPAILLEGDQPASPPPSGPGQRYVLGLEPASVPTGFEEELPEAYGTGQLRLIARDPHWLYAHWDLSLAQQRRHNARSADRHLILRVYIGAVAVRPIEEVHVHPESHHWFVHVDRAGTRYVAELGYYDKGGAWTAISISDAALTPPDAVSEDTSVELATIPIDLPTAKLVSLVREAARTNAPLAEALEKLRGKGRPAGSAPAAPTALPGPSPAPWTAAREQALEKVTGWDLLRCVGMGSAEITELIQRQREHELASLSAAQPSAPSSPLAAPAAPSSPTGGGAPEKGFWFNVNAELIVYGATEPTATVAIGGRPVRLRPDGSFSCRFALPDGSYALPVVAVSADRTDGRAAELSFSRSTEYRGDVGIQPQDPELKSPVPENL